MKNHYSSASGLGRWSLRVVLAASMLWFICPPASAQTATTLPASGMLNDAAMLNGTVNPQGTDTTAWFEWASGLGFANTTPPLAVGSGTASVPLSTSLTGLTAGVTYHYRLVASNSVAVIHGAAQTFWSPAMMLNSPNPLTNECHMAFADSGVELSASPIALAAGSYHSLALRGDGMVVGWGAGGPGTSGYPNYSQTTIPASATNVMALAAGQYHSLALKGDGTVVGWGWNDFGGQATIPASATNVVALAGGYVHSLALRGDGTVVGWGRNDYGQTTIPASATNVVALAAGAIHSLALKGNGTVVGWGAGGPGTSGDPNYGQSTIPVSATNVVVLAAGYVHSLALKGDGTVVGWGNNNYGQIAIPASATNVVAIAAGEYHSLALKGDGTMVGWGYSGSGQTTISVSVTNVVTIAAGGFFSLALKADGTVVGWGENNHGQTNIPASAYQLNLDLSVSGTVDPNAPGVYNLTYRATNGLSAAGTATRTVVVADTQAPVLALLGDNPLLHALGTPFTDPGATATDLCADDLTGSIVITNTVNASLPGRYTNTYTVTDASGNTAQISRTILVVELPLATTLSASGLLNDAATLNGTVNPHGVDTTAWFEWASGLGFANTTPPVAVGSGTASVPLSASLTGLTAGVTYHYRLVASNSVGVTRGAAQTFWSPAMVLSGPNPLTNECHVTLVDPGANVSASPIALAAGHGRSLALKADGTVVGWGLDNFGQITIPVSATNTVALAAGYYHSLALNAKGKVVGWGYNGDGQTNVPASVTNVVAIAAGYFHNLALRADSTVAGWGRNDYGETTIPASATNVVALAAGAYYNLALKGDGTVVGWGYNGYGQTNIPASATNVVALAAGGNHSLALKGDGTVIGWGNNLYGQTTIPASATNVVAIAAGYDHSLALKKDGTVIGWGYYYDGQISIPASTTNVVALAAGKSHSLALKGDGTVVGWGLNDYGQTTITASLSTLNLPASVSGTVDPNAPGVYILTYSATNALGAAGSAARTVVVADTWAPVLTLLGDNPLLHALGAPFTDPGATATDLCAGDLTGSIVITNTVNFSLPGSYTNTYTVTDASGNTAQTNRVVTVLLPPQPVFTGYSVPAPGQFRLQATGTAGLTYTLQTSTNLVNWVNHTNVVAGPGGSIQNLLQRQNSAPICFFRLRWPADPTLSQPTLLGLAHHSHGRIRLQATGAADLTYTLQSSTNLVNWVNYTNLVASPGGLIDCWMDMATNAPACFYRLRWP